MGKILLVGGAGYIGSHVTNYLIHSGQEPVVYDNLSTGHRTFLSGGIFIKGSLEDKDKLKTVLQKYHIKTIMHFAGFSSVGESVLDPGKYYKNNVINSYNLLECAIECQVKNIVFSSSCAIYGPPQEKYITENHPYNPISPYAKTKLAIEFLLEDYAQAHHLNYVSLRYFNACGADPSGKNGESHHPETHLIPLVLEAALHPDKIITINGTDYPTPDGTCIRDYIHVQDIARAHWLATQYLIETQQNNVFNLGNGTGYSVRQIIDIASQITKQTIAFTEGKRRSGDPAILVGSSKKIQDLLKWEPAYPELETMLQHAWSWQKNQLVTSHHKYMK